MIIMMIIKISCTRRCDDSTVKEDNENKNEKNENDMDGGYDTFGDEEIKNIDMDGDGIIE